MLRNRVISSLIALGALSVFSLSALAQGGKPAETKPAEKGAKTKPQRDDKGRFMKADAKKPGPARDEKGRFVKSGDKTATAGAPKMAGDAGKMASSSKMASSAKPGKPVWNAKLKRWQGPDGKIMSEADALKAGGKK
jgi:hypothetical protein